MTDHELLELAARLARSAADAILAVRAAGFAVERKSDHSPVTEADHVAEAIILEGLRAAVPEIQMFSSASRSNVPAVSTEKCVTDRYGTE